MATEKNEMDVTTGKRKRHIVGVPAARYRVLDPKEAEIHIERQHTLCYVGMTRAADELYLLTVKRKESRFVDELAGKVIRQ
jgi:superfamily I DNA/RNA helicase